jgi:seryl-tRNA synthetase
MLDIKWIRNNPEQLNDLLKARGIGDIDVPRLIQLDEERKKIIATIQKLQQERNSLAKQKSTDVQNIDAQNATQLAKTINKNISQNQENLNLINADFSYIMDRIPNLLEEEVPFGTSEQENKIISRWGEERIDSIPNSIHHSEIATKLGAMDSLQTVKMSGSRFITFTRALAELKRALINFMLDIHVKEFGFYEISPPYIVKEHAMYNTGQLPKFDQDSFVTTQGHRLIPTGEVPLVNLLADLTVEVTSLPMRFVSVTPCFRSEAGSAGKDTKGIIRLHQFTKVELVSVIDDQSSKEEHQYLLDAAARILKMLELPHQVVLLCSWDTGFASQKTYDLEVWMPGEQKYREISSCSNCGSFQARRMNAKYKVNGSTFYLHTLNASGLAIERTLAAILENYFDKDVLHVPKVLQPYLSGKTVIKPEKSLF